MQTQRQALELSWQLARRAERSELSDETRRRSKGGEEERDGSVKERSYLSDMLPFHLEVFFVVRDVGSLGPAVLFSL